jgi:hypothetical protein
MAHSGQASDVLYPGHLTRAPTTQPIASPASLCALDACYTKCAAMEMGCPADVKCLRNGRCYAHKGNKVDLFSYSHCVNRVCALCGNKDLPYSILQRLAILQEPTVPSHPFSAPNTTPSAPARDLNSQGEVTSPAGPSEIKGGGGGGLTVCVCVCVGVCVLLLPFARG